MFEGTYREAAYLRAGPSLRLCETCNQHSSDMVTSTQCRACRRAKQRAWYRRNAKHANEVSEAARKRRLGRAVMV